MELTKKKAIELSIKKWEWIVENDGSEDFLLDEIPELNDLSANCGLCEKYWKNDAFCRKCPINKDHDCYDKKHLFHIWLYDKTKKNAQKVLDLIKAIK